MAVSNDLFEEGDGTVMAGVGKLFDGKMTTSGEIEEDDKTDGYVTALITVGDEDEAEVAVVVEVVDILASIGGTMTEVVGAESGLNGNGLLIFFFER